MRFLTLCLFGFVSLPLLAGVKVFPKKPGDLGSIVIENPSLSRTLNDLEIRIDVDCYPINLRAGINPLAPGGILRVELDFNVAGSTNPHLLKVYFPTRLFFPNYQEGPPVNVNHIVAVDNHSGETYQKAFENLVYDPASDLVPGRRSTLKMIVLRPNITSGIANVAPDGSFSQSDFPISVTRLAIGQGGQVPGGIYYGSPGPVTGYTTFTVSPPIISVKADFIGAAEPGQPAGVQYAEGNFCGAYYSPLMLFFDDRRPKFTGMSDFPLGFPSDFVRWVEPQAVGYFLARDLNGDGQVSTLNELFGKQGGFKNGFEKLATLDLNKDGVVDAKDPGFNSLLMWNDTNGNGISEKEELFHLKDRKVSSISVRYLEDQIIHYPYGAELRQRSTFDFLERGRSKKGSVIDVWLKPIPGTRKATAPEEIPAG